MQRTPTIPLAHPVILDMHHRSCCIKCSFKNENTLQGAYFAGWKAHLFFADMAATFQSRRNGAISCTQFAAQQLHQLRRIGLALGGFHCLSDQRIDGLLLAGAEFRN